MVYIEGELTKVSLQGHHPSGSDVGRPPEEDPQQHPVHEGPDEPNHFSRGLTLKTKSTHSVYTSNLDATSNQPCILLEPC